MAAFVKFYTFPLHLGQGKHDFSADQLKIALFSTQPDATTAAVFADLSGEVSAGNGYTAGGANVTTTSWTQSAGTATLVVADATITASGGSVGPFQYVVLYNGTATNDELIGYYDYGSSQTLLDTEPFIFDADSGGIIEIA